MKELTKKMQFVLLWGGWLLSFILFLWGIFGMYYQFKDNLKIILTFAL